MADIRIENADAIEAMERLPARSFDLVIADPPYNLAKDYGTTNDRMSRVEFDTFVRRWLQEAVRLLADHGTIYVFMGVRHISYLHVLLEEYGLLFNSWICWHYTQGMGKTRGFSPRHDDILMFTKSERFTFNLDDVRVPQKYYRGRNNMRGANPGDVWQFSHVHYSNPNRRAHPTQKPEGLIERMVLASSNPGDRVLDPFCGSGTTARVCQQLGRAFLGFDNNPEYVVDACARLEEEFTGFDSVDPRMERVPLDLRDADLRARYLVDHERWFLQRHGRSLARFSADVAATYGPHERLARNGPHSSLNGELPL